ncbi:CHRD domain-containing protein [Nesterenkonia muleiensis]|uniref:CHRD domain-containing protein n=1 Tax=Nesterenkonia muleiensis TaxID=2282648 RepID=UPI000E751B2B|nr:CHRD domain-containing protein [Nesterenkonia muleiensis]
MATQTIRRRTVMGGCVAAGAAVSLMLAGPAHAHTDHGDHVNEVDWPEDFTSAYSAMAVPDEVVVPEGEPSPIDEDATGDFMLWLNSELDVICYEIALEGVTGNYESPAFTATHIHEGPTGEAGPPRVAFPDPQSEGDGPRTSSGCMEGPFVTGVEDDDGNDHGDWFTVSQIEDDPTAFYADVHTEEYLDGVVRGQLTQVPLDGVETGGGGETAQQGIAIAGPAAGVGAVALLAAGAYVLIMRRSRNQQV